MAPPYTTNDDCSGDTAPLSRALEESVLDASPGSPQHDRGHDNLSASSDSSSALAWWRREDLISGMRAVQEVAGNGGCSPTKARVFPPISFFSLSFFAPSLFLSLLQRVEAQIAAAASG